MKCCWFEWSKSITSLVEPVIPQCCGSSTTQHSTWSEFKDKFKKCMRAKSGSSPSLSVVVSFQDTLDSEHVKCSQLAATSDESVRPFFFFSSLWHLPVAQAYTKYTSRLCNGKYHADRHTQPLRLPHRLLTPFSCKELLNVSDTKALVALLSKSLGSSGNGASINGM